MKRLSVVLLVLTLASLGLGCGGAETPVERAEEREGVEEAAPPADLPDYEVTKEESGELVGRDAKIYSVSTDATSEEDLRALTQFFRSESPNVDVLSVSYYSSEPTAEMSGAGYWFSDEAAANAVLSSMYPAEADIQAEVDEAMSNGGLYIFPITETVDDMIAEQCRTWDYETLGDPPPEWQCERT